MPAERIEHTQRLKYPQMNYIIVLQVLRNHRSSLLPKGPLYGACETTDNAKRIRSGDKTSRSHNDDHNEECTRGKSALTRLGNTLLNRDQRRRQKPMLALGQPVIHPQSSRYQVCHHKPQFVTPLRAPMETDYPYAIEHHVAKATPLKPR